MPALSSNEFPGSGDNGAASTRAGNWVAALRDIAGRSAQARERCELCGAELESHHAHLIEPPTQRLLCACAPCALLFSDSTAARFRRVPEEVARLTNFTLDAAQWDALGIPINMVFFVRSSAPRRWLALYPGPAGATESQLDLAAWDELMRTNEAMSTLADDVEALLINRLDAADDCFRVPIDRCYALVGLIRRHWRGVAGGSAAENAIAQFLAQLRVEAGESLEAGHA